MHFDLIIVGGGLVGASLLQALSTSTFKIALIDAKDPSKEDQRLFALNASSCHFLENISLWDDLKKYSSPIHEVQVSQQGRFGALRLSRKDVQLEALGYVIPAKYIEASFKEKLSSSPNISVFSETSLKKLKLDGDLCFLTVETKDRKLELSASLLIAADGTRSTVRSELNISAETFDYGQSAIVTETSLQRSHQQIAYERFNRDGAIAMLPMQGDRCATIWTVNRDKAHELMQLSDEDFLSVLAKTFGYRLGRLIGITKRHLFPLQKVLARESHRHNVLLIGNAMHTLHPIAAQGFNLALYEVAKLTEAIIEKSQSIHWMGGMIPNQVPEHTMPFTQHDLEKVSVELKKQQAISVGVSHQLSKVFATQSSLLSSLLSLGMLSIDLIHPLKKNILHHLLARKGSVPHLLMKKSASS